MALAKISLSCILECSNFVLNSNLCKFLFTDQMFKRSLVSFDYHTRLFFRTTLGGSHCNLLCLLKSRYVLPFLIWELQCFLSIFSLQLGLFLNSLMLTKKNLQEFSHIFFIFAEKIFLWGGTSTDRYYSWRSIRSINLNSISCYSILQ